MRENVSLPEGRDKETSNEAHEQTGQGKHMKPDSAKQNSSSHEYNTHQSKKKKKYKKYNAVPTQAINTRVEHSD